jgi:3-deoxy-manno-octulosonate cytidylyltransferase (CMP-KDO synthetase)
VQHVVDQARMCRRVSRIIVAADDERIADALRPYGTECVLTDPGHPSGTDRVAEVARKLGDAASSVINVQGDEPEIEPGVIDELDRFLEESEFPVCTAATPMRKPSEPDEANLVKVVVSGSGRAMYFSRLAIPYRRDRNDEPPTYYLHVGIYGYRREALIRLAQLRPTPCELAEKLEQLRALENDIPIGVTIVERATHGIDTPQQYEAFVRRYRPLAASNQECAP